LNNFIKSSTDSFIFVKHLDATTTVVFVYVYDIIIIKNDEKEIKNLEDYLKNKFKIKDLRNLSIF
jgi:Reverse transcriptase (RNA-dependent DNA polymerase)